MCSLITKDLKHLNKKKKTTQKPKNNILLLSKVSKPIKWSVSMVVSMQSHLVTSAFLALTPDNFLCIS